MAVLPGWLRPLEARARREETPCGNGSLVWHFWGEGQPVVLLHGGSGSWTHWVRNIEPLVASGRQVLVPDMPGFGESALWPAGMDASALPEPIEAGLRALAGDAEKVGRTAEQNVELLRGTDLGYEAREASVVVGAFARELLDAATDPSRYEPFDAERISRLVDMLDAALSGLGQDYAPHAESRRRLRRRS